MITVLFATHNGARTLPGVLESYCKLVGPEGGWKLVIVDNASTDGSGEIVASYADRLPLVCLREDTLGKNVALNAAICRIEGDLAVITDDDVFPRPGWLVAMRAAADAHPAYAIFGGAIFPRWEVPPPKWVLDWVPQDVVFSLIPPSIQEGSTTAAGVFGPNMAVRTEVFRSGFRFDVSIGPRGKAYAQGSETEFVMRLRRNNYAAWHVRGAEVEHFIREYQMDRSWVLERAIRFGRGQYRLSLRKQSPRTAFLFGAPRHLFRELAGHSLKVLLHTVANDKQKQFHARWELNCCRGMIIEARILSGGRKPHE